MKGYIKSIYIIKTLLIYSYVVIFSFCCSEDKIEYNLQKEPLWKNKKEIIIQKLLTIGSNDLDNPNYLFGHVRDIAIDKDDNVYVLDNINYKASKFTPDGKFIRNYSHGKGQGPGEFQSVANICVDNSNNIYISDDKQRRIVVFDSSNRFIKNFRTEKNIRPLSDLIAYKDSLLFVGIQTRQFGVLWKGGLFQMYSLPDGNYVGSIGRSDWLRKNWKIFLGTNSICINKKNDNIIISHTCPYEIEVFSKEGSLLRRFGRIDSSFGKVLYDPDNKDLMLAAGASLCMTCLPDGKIVNVIRHGRELKIPPYSDYIRYFDFFDDHGNYLITVPEEKFGIHEKYSLKMASDREGNIWLSFVEPYPYIAKFKIEFKNKQT